MTFKLESRKCQIVVAYEAKKIAGKVTDLSNWEYHIREGDEIPLGFCTGALSPGVESPLVMLVIGVGAKRHKVIIFDDFKVLHALEQFSKKGLPIRILESLLTPHCCFPFQQTRIKKCYTKKILLY